MRSDDNETRAASEDRQSSGTADDVDRGHDWAWTTWVRVGRKHWRRVAEKFWRVPTEVKKERYAICVECEEFVPGTTQCRQCYCAMGIKTWYASVACPKGKWPALSPPDSPSD